MSSVEWLKPRPPGRWWECFARENQRLPRRKTASSGVGGFSRSLLCVDPHLETSPPRQKKATDLIMSSVQWLKPWPPGVCARAREGEIEARVCFDLFPDSLFQGLKGQGVVTMLLPMDSSGNAELKRIASYVCWWQSPEQTLGNQRHFHGDRE